MAKQGPTAQQGGDRAVPGDQRGRRGTAQLEVLVAAVLGAAVALPFGLRGTVPVALLVGWDTASLAYMVWIWSVILRRDAEQTADRATTTDPDRAVTDFLLLIAAVASLAAVGVVLVRASQQQGAEEAFGVGLGLASVVLSWALVHTVYTLRYAHLYYVGPDGGIDFNGTGPPTYVDFAYLAFSVGMTYQVSDTALTSRAVRATVLRHSLLSFLFGTGILATTINLVASLSSK